MALCAVAAITMAPARTMPWIELAADISGVCKVAGTLLITSKPTQRLSTKMVMSTRRAGYGTRGPFIGLVGGLVAGLVGGTSGGRGIGLRWLAVRCRQRGMNYRSAAGDNHAGLQLVIAVQH